MTEELITINIIFKSGAKTSLTGPAPNSEQVGLYGALMKGDTGWYNGFGFYIDMSEVVFMEKLK